MNHKISIIIPVLNEETNIGKLLEHLMANFSGKNTCEIIVVDGGSLDGTPAIVKTFAKINNTKNTEAYYYIDNAVIDTSQVFKHNSKIKITLLNSKKGRAKQMNLGAKYANGNILYFLHADSFPPKNFDDLIISEVKKGNEAGCFKMQFNSNHWWLKLASWFTKFNWRICRGGDQSQFITKTLFNTIGGFNESYIIYEDNILINELYARNQFVVINKTLKTSARLYKKHGVFKLQLIYLVIYIKRWFGADAEALLSYYKKHIS